MTSQSMNQFTGKSKRPASCTNCFRERRSTIEKSPNWIYQVIDFMIAVYLTANYQKV